eukprot:scaffold125220_cov42-Phaeocystis_antarctica.AAC.1
MVRVRARLGFGSGPESWREPGSELGSDEVRGCGERRVHLAPRERRSSSTQCRSCTAPHRAPSPTRQLRRGAKSGSGTPSKSGEAPG